MLAFSYKNGKVWHPPEGRKWLQRAGSGQNLAKLLIGQGQVRQPITGQKRVLGNSLVEGVYKLLQIIQEARLARGSLG